MHPTKRRLRTNQAAVCRLRPKHHPCGADCTAGGLRTCENKLCDPEMAGLRHSSLHGGKGNLYHDKPDTLLFTSSYLPCRTTKHIFRLGKNKFD